jgi:hypothetical protein
MTWNCFWLWRPASHGIVRHRIHRIRHLQLRVRSLHRLFHRPRGSWLWTCKVAGPPLLAIPPLAWVWHPSIAPLPPISPPPDTGGGYDTFFPGGAGGLGGFLPSGVGQLIPSAFAGSPSLLNVPPSLTGTNCCTVLARPSPNVTEPGMAALLVLAVVVVIALKNQTDKVSRMTTNPF